MTIRTVLLALPLMLCGWLAVLIFVGLMSDAAPASVVLFPSSGFVARLPEDVAILAQNAISITLQSDSGGFARSLYAGGAWLVLPAGLAGCLPMPKGV